MHTPGSERPGPLNALSTADVVIELDYAQDQRWRMQLAGREVDADCWDRRCKRCLEVLSARQEAFDLGLLEPPPDAAA